MTEPGNEMAADTGGGDLFPVDREQVTRTLKAALVQGRLTEDEYDERAGRASASRSRAELAVLTADLPVERMDALARAPAARHVWIGVSVSIISAGVVAGVLLGHPDVGLAILAFLIAAVTVLVAPIVTVGVMIDVWRQKRDGGQLPSWPAPGAMAPSVALHDRLGRPLTRVTATPSKHRSKISHWEATEGSVEPGRRVTRYE